MRKMELYDKSTYEILSKLDPIVDIDPFALTHAIGPLILGEYAFSLLR